MHRKRIDRLIGTPYPTPRRLQANRHTMAPHLNRTAVEQVRARPRERPCVAPERKREVSQTCCQPNHIIANVFTKIFSNSLIFIDILESYAILGRRNEAASAEQLRFPCRASAKKAPIQATGKCALRLACARKRMRAIRRANPRRRRRAPTGAGARAGYARIRVPPLRRAGRRGRPEGSGTKRDEGTTCRTRRDRTSANGPDARILLSRLREAPGEGPAAVRPEKPLPD